MANLNIRIDRIIKDQVTETYIEVCLKMTIATNLFLRTVIREQGISFELKLEVLNATCFLLVYAKIFQYGCIKTALEQGTQECYIEPDWSFVYEICVDLVILQKKRSLNCL